MTFLANFRIAEEPLAAFLLAALACNLSLPPGCVGACFMAVVVFPISYALTGSV
jgi:hypothetical protein